MEKVKSKIRLGITLFSVISVCTFYSFTQSTNQSEYQSIRKHIETFSSDDMEGRLTGTIGEEKAADYIKKQFENLGLKPLPNHDFIHNFNFNYANDPHAEEKLQATIHGKNVVAFLDNNAEFTFVIGAHYDHLGRNEYNLSLDQSGKGQIHNGADDNASGVAALLQLAELYSQNSSIEPVNYIFACFSGEELGLMGSKALAETIKKEFPKTTLMINFDMIGRMDQGYKLNIGGIGSSRSFEEVIHTVKPTQLTISVDSSGIGPSDHTSFYLQNIPVLFFFTGVHSDYHKPSDDADKINYQGLELILQYANSIISNLAKRPNLEFKKTNQVVEKESAKFKVTLGIFPDYNDYKDGLHILEVIENRPAQKVGLQKGDIITKIGKTKVTDIYSYMEALSKLNAGKTFKLNYTRENIKKQLKITL